MRFEREVFCLGRYANAYRPKLDVFEWFWPSTIISFSVGALVWVRFDFQYFNIEY